MLYNILNVKFNKNEKLFETIIGSIIKSLKSLLDKIGLYFLLVEVYIVLTK